jgi:SAM-dependent methyltransferase
MLHPQDDRAHWRAHYHDAAGDAADHARVGYTSAAHSGLMHAAVRRAIGPAVGLRILDAGCGDGQVTGPLAASNTVIGVDFTLPMARRARVRGLAPVCADLRPLPFRPASFDLVLCIETLQHVDDPLDVVAGMLPLVKPGGRLVLSALSQRSLLRHVVRSTALLRGTVEPRLLSAQRCLSVVAPHGFDVAPPCWVGYVPGFVVQPQQRLASWLVSWLATNFILVARRPHAAEAVSGAAAPA